MSKSLVLPPEHSVRIQNALRKCGVKDLALVHKLGEAEELEKIIRYLEGDADIVMREYLVDCSKEPHLNNMSVVWNHPLGKIDVNRLGEARCHFTTVTLLAQNKTINEYSEAFRSRNAGNYALFKFLFENQKYIPRGRFWTGKTIYFPGTCFVLKGQSFPMTVSVEAVLKNLFCSCLTYDEETREWKQSLEPFAVQFMPQLIRKRYLCLDFLAEQ